jgi:hypothetical protein
MMACRHDKYRGGTFSLGDVDLWAMTAVRATGAAAALRCHCYEFLLVYHAESGRATPVFLVLLKEVARLDM